MSELSQQELEIIIDKITNNKITHLWLGRDGFSSEQASEIAQVLEKNVSIKKITITTPDIEKEGLKVLLRVIQKNKTVHSLCIRGYMCSVMSEFIEVIRGNDSINFLEIRYSSRVTQELIEAIKVNKCIRFLYIIDCGITDEEAVMIGNMLADNNTLELLDLSSGCTLGYSDNHVGVNGAKAIANSLKTNKSLKFLNLNGNSALEREGNTIGDEGAIAIAESLQYNQSLISLHVGIRNKIGNKGFKALIESLKKNNSLSNLYFFSNPLTDDPSKSQYMFDSLRENKSLTSLDIGYCEFGDNRVVATFKALQENNTLTSITLHCTHLTDIGYKAIINCLKKNKTLTDLTIEGPWTDKIAERFYETYVPQIKELIKRNCKIRDDFLELVKETILNESKLVHLQSAIKEGTVPLAHQVYALEKIMCEVSEISGEGQNIKQHLGMIIFLLESNVPVTGAILLEEMFARDEKISAIIKSYYPQKFSILTKLADHTLNPKVFQLDNHNLQERIFILEQEIARINSSISLSADPLQSRIQVSEMKRELSELRACQDLLQGQQNNLNSINFVDSRLVNPSSLLTKNELAQNDYIKSHSYLSEANQVTKAIFNQAFIAAIVMSSKEFTTEDHNITRGLEAAAEFVSGFPLAAPLVLFVSSVSQSTLSARKEGKFANISDLNPTNEVSNSERLSSRISALLTIITQDEIREVSHNKITHNTQHKLQSIKFFYSQVKEKFKEFSRRQINKIDHNIVRGFFGDEYSLVELLAISNAKDILTYIMDQDRASILQTKKDIASGNYDALFDRIIKNSFGIESAVAHMASIIANSVSAPSDPSSLSNSKSDNDNYLPMPPPRNSQESGSNLERIVHDLQEKNRLQELEIRRQSNELRKAQADIAMAQKTTKEVKEATNAVFHTFVGGTNQVTNSVKTKEGVAIRVINPDLEERMDAMEGEVVSNKSEVDNVKETCSYLEEEMHKRDRKNKKADSCTIS